MCARCAYVAVEVLVELYLCCRIYRVEGRLWYFYLMARIIVRERNGYDSFGASELKFNADESWRKQSGMICFPQRLLVQPDATRASTFE